MVFAARPLSPTIDHRTSLDTAGDFETILSIPLQRHLQDDDGWCDADADGLLGPCHHEAVVRLERFPRRPEEGEFVPAWREPNASEQSGRGPLRRQRRQRERVAVHTHDKPLELVRGGYVV